MKKLKINSVLFMLILITFGSQESFSQSLRGLVNEGVENYNEGNFSDAEVNFKKGVEKSPESFEAKFNLGDAFFKQERYDEAIKSYNSALAFAKNDLEKAEEQLDNADPPVSISGRGRRFSAGAQARRAVR